MGFACPLRDAGDGSLPGGCWQSSSHVPFVNQQWYVFLVVRPTVTDPPFSQQVYRAREVIVAMSLLQLYRQLLDESPET